MATQKLTRTYSSGIELRLKVLRVLLGIKRESMAEILGINLNTYSAYENENNIRKISDDLLENIFTKVKDAAVAKDIFIDKAVAGTLDKEWLFFGNKNIVTDKSNMLALGFCKAYRITMVMRELGISVTEVASDLYLTEISLNDLLIDEFGLIKSLKLNHKAEAEDRKDDEINDLDEKTRLKRKIKKGRKRKKRLETNMISWSNVFLQNAFINYFGLNAHWFETGEGIVYQDKAITSNFQNEDRLQKAVLDRLMRYENAINLNIAKKTNYVNFLSDVRNKSYNLIGLYEIASKADMNLEWLLAGYNNFEITIEATDTLYYNPEAPLALPECDMPLPPDLWIIVNNRWYNVSKKDIVLPVLPSDSIVKNSSKREKMGIINLRKRIVSYLEMCSYPKDRIADQLGISKSRIELWQKIEIMPQLALLIKLAKEDHLNLHWLITGLTSPDYRYNIYDFFRTIDNPPIQS